MMIREGPVISNQQARDAFLVFYAWRLNFQILLNTVSGSHHNHPRSTTLRGKPWITDAVERLLISSGIGARKNHHSHVLVRSKKIPRNLWWYDGHHPWMHDKHHIFEEEPININDSKWLNRNQNKEGREMKYSKSVSRWVTKWITPLNLVNWWDERWRRDVIVMRLRNILYSHLRRQIQKLSCRDVALIISIHQLTGIKYTVTDYCRKLCVVTWTQKFMLPVIYCLYQESWAFDWSVYYSCRKRRKRALSIVNIRWQKSKQRNKTITLAETEWPLSAVPMFALLYACFEKDRKQTL